MCIGYVFTKYPYGNCNTCIRCNNLDLIEQALTRIFEQEGCRRIPKPPLPENPLPVMTKLRHFPAEVETYLWVIGLFVGNLGWTIVKTSPYELLCRRARSAMRPLLSELAMQTSCDAFHSRVEERYWGALLEADASGQTFVSGYLPDCYDVKDMRFYDEPITEPTAELHFFLLNVQEELQAVSRIPRINYEERKRRQEDLEALYQQGCKQAADAESEWEELEKSVNYKERERRLKELRALSQQGRKQEEDAESEWEELEKSAFEIADKALGQTLIAPSGDWHYWYFGNLLYKAYANPQQLEADGVRLLYFQPANSSGADVAEIWEEMSWNAPAAPEPNMDEIPFLRAVDAKSVRLGLQDAWEYEANRPQVGWEWRKF